MKKLLVTLSFIFTANSLAGFLVEPYLNYTFGSGDTSYNNISDISGSGPEIGARLGGSYLGAMAGLDVAKGTFKSETKVGVSTYEDDFSKTRIGLFAGYDFPILLRAWAAYHFSNTFKDGDAGGLYEKGSKFTGNPIEFGIGFTPLPLISVNAGYRINTSDEFEDADGTKTALNGANEVTLKEIFIGVSLPLDL